MTGLVWLSLCRDLQFQSNTCEMAQCFLCYSFLVKVNCCLRSCSLRRAWHCCTGIICHFAKLMGKLVPEWFVLPPSVDLTCTLWRLTADSKALSKPVLNGWDGYWHSAPHSAGQQHEAVCVCWLLNYLFSFPGGFCSLAQVCQHHLQSQKNQQCKYIPNLKFCPAVTNAR